MNGMPSFSGALLSSTNEEDEDWLYANTFPTPVWCEDKNLAMDDRSAEMSCCKKSPTS